MSIIKKVIWLSALLMFFFAIQNLSASSFTNIAKLLGANNSDVTVGDIDNDGLIDVVVGGNLLPSGLTNILVIYKNLGNFNFTPIYTSRLYPADSNDRTGLALGDIDNDGDLDLVWEYYLNNIPHMVILKNNSSGNFSVSQNISSSAYPPTPILYDMNRDGTLDLVDNGIIYTNSGNGAFSSNQSLPSCISFAIGDFNKDGCPDIAFMSLDSWIYTNSGMGVLNKKYPFPKMNEGKISLGDVDADGNLDFIMTGRIGTPSTNFAKMIHNDGSGNFTVINNGFFPSTSGTSAAMGDIYNNGLIDLILSVDNTSGLKTYRNNITDKGTYVLEDSWPSDGYQNGSTIMANFNSDDNNLDFCVIGQYGNVNKLGIFKNLSSINNSRPNAPAGMEATNLGGFWRLKWDCVNSDDHTLMKQLMRYNIAIGTNSGHYNICSTNISYPRGSANIGNVVATFPNPYYQTKIPVTKNVYWKVCSIDSAFAHSAYCAEQEINFPPTPPVSGFFPSASVRVTNKGAIMFKWNPGSDPNLKDRPLLAYTVIVSTNSDDTNNI